jgi:hypothetical protein
MNPSPPMSPWVPIACTIALGILGVISHNFAAYLARQQQLRIEKHRLDPSFPLEKPPGRVRVFFRNYSADVVMVLLNGSLLLYWLTRGRPVDHLEVAMVAYLVSMTVAGLYSGAELRLRRGDLEIMGRMSEVDGNLAKDVEKLNEQAAQLTEIVASIVRRIGDGEQ